MTGFEIIWTIIGFIVLVLLILILRTRLIIYTGRKINYKVEYSHRHVLEKCVYFMMRKVLTVRLYLGQDRNGVNNLILDSGCL